MTTFKGSDLTVIAVIQDSPVFLNLPGSMDKACRLIAEAASNGAELIVFPETWLPGYPVWLDHASGAGLWEYGPAKAIFRVLYLNSPELDGTEVGRLMAATEKHNCTLVMGMHERIGASLYNTMLFGAGGKVLGVHRKLMPTYNERMIWGQGDGSTLSAFDTPVGRIGGLICWEHWMPLARAAMHSRLELIHIAQWPTVKELSLLASRHYAFEGQCFVVAAGCAMQRGELEITSGDASLRDRANEMIAQIGGQSSDFIFGGGSTVIGPDAACLTPPTELSRDTVYCTIDPQSVIEGRLYLDVNGHYSRPDVFSLRVNQHPFPNLDLQ